MNLKLRKLRVCEPIWCWLGCRGPEQTETDGHSAQSGHHRWAVGGSKNSYFREPESQLTISAPAHFILFLFSLATTQMAGKLSEMLLVGSFGCIWSTSFLAPPC